MQNSHANFRILYLSFSDMASSGVYRKALGFCRAMDDLCRGSEIQFKGININVLDNVIHGFDHDNSLGYFELRQLNSRLPKVFSKIRILRAICRSKPIFQAAYQEINRFRPDVIIVRYYMLEIPALFNPKKVKRDVLFISEHNSKELEELSNIFAFSLFPVAYERIKSRRFLKNVDAIIGVTSEIAKYQVKRACRNIPYFVLTNGIDVNRHLMKRYLEFAGNVLKMIFISSDTSPWHGLERLLTGMKKYNGTVKLELNIVGSISQKTVRLVNLLNLKHKVVFHGFKIGKALDKIFDAMHIAIGTLALHRNNLKYGSTLKTREYMARGIPFLISHIDEDVEDGFPLFLRLPADDSPVNMEEVIDFSQNIYGKYGAAIPSMMRDYAMEKMDYTVKVRSLLNFILEHAG
jgi:hypothetical protein